MGLSVNIGSPDKPFGSIYANQLHNKWGSLEINTVSTNEPLTSQNEEGNVSLGLKHDGTLTVTPNGLSVVPKIILQSELDLKDQAPIRLIPDTEVDPNDLIGTRITLQYETDDFEVDDSGRLHTILPTIKGFGAIKAGSLSDVDVIDEWFDQAEDATIPKVTALRLQTSDDFTQKLT
ncbi:hypothetical protein HK097_006500, partial [Rhizophlyctis rosea]